jgi:hypothetical protein
MKAKQPLGPNDSRNMCNRVLAGYDEPASQAVVVLDASCSNFDPKLAGANYVPTQQTAYSITSSAVVAE